MEPIKTEYRDLGAGQNEGVAGSEILDNECQSVQNFFPFGKKLIRRGGTEKLTTAAFASDITGILNYKETDEVMPVTIVGTHDGFAKLVAGVLTAIANTGAAISSDDHPWTMLQYNNIGYGLRKNAGLRRFTNLVHMDAGIAPASAGPVLADGGAGDLTAADYRGVVTGYNSLTGAESDPSPESNVLSLGASKQIRWSSIPTFTNSQVNARRLYRTLPDQQGVYLFVAQINNNTDTVYDDNIAIADLGGFASFSNGLPPADLEFGAEWNERIWASDGVDLWYTEPFLPESWHDDNRIRITPDDGHRMSVVHADGSRLIAGKTNKVHAITGTDPSNFSLETISDRHGCTSHHSMKSAEGQLLWKGENSFYRIYGGGQPESISTIKMKNTMARIPPEREQYIVSAIYPKFGWYLSAVTLDSGDKNNAILCYNYKSDAWCVFKLPDDSPAIFGEVFDSEVAQILYCALYDGHLFQMDSGLTDFGNAIVAKFRTKAYKNNQAGLISALRRFFVHVTTVAANATFRVFVDGASAHHKERSGLSLYRPEAWKGFDFSLLGKPTSEYSLEMEYSGVPSIEIEGLAFEVVPINRRGKTY